VKVLARQRKLDEAIAHRERQRREQGLPLREDDIPDLDVVTDLAWRSDNMNFPGDTADEEDKSYWNSREVDLRDHRSGSKFL
jgi:hypothetical protein